MRKKICDMCTLLKYAKNAAIAYSHKTDMPSLFSITLALGQESVLSCLASGQHWSETDSLCDPVEC